MKLGTANLTQFGFLWHASDGLCKLLFFLFRDAFHSLDGSNESLWFPSFLRLQFVVVWFRIICKEMDRNVHCMAHWLESCSSADTGDCSFFLAFLLVLKPRSKPLEMNQHGAEPDWRRITSLASQHYVSVKNRCSLVWPKIESRI